MSPSPGPPCLSETPLDAEWRVELADTLALALGRPPTFAQPNLKRTTRRMDVGYSKTGLTF